MNSPIHSILITVIAALLALLTYTIFKLNNLLENTSSNNQSLALQNRTNNFTQPNIQPYTHQNTQPNAQHHTTYTHQNTQHQTTPYMQQNTQKPEQPDTQIPQAQKYNSEQTPIYSQQSPEYIARSNCLDGNCNTQKALPETINNKEIQEEKSIVYGNAPIQNTPLNSSPLTKRKNRYSTFEYRVKKGDTMKKIADKYDLEINEIKNLNTKIKDINKINIDDIILLPTS